VEQAQANVLFDRDGCGRRVEFGRQWYRGVAPAVWEEAAAHCDEAQLALVIAIAAIRRPAPASTPSCCRCSHQHSNCSRTRRRSGSAPARTAAGYSSTRPRTPAANGAPWTPAATATRCAATARVSGTLVGIVAQTPAQTNEPPGDEPRAELWTASRACNRIKNTRGSQAAENADAGLRRVRNYPKTLSLQEVSTDGRRRERALPRSSIPSPDKTTAPTQGSGEIKERNARRGVNKVITRATETGRNAQPERLCKN